MFDLEEFLPYRLYQAAEQTSQGFSDAYRQRFGLNRTQWRVLFNVGQFGPLTAGEVTQGSGLEKSKVSRAVAKLESLGWVARGEDSRDRRRQPIALTDQGQQRFSELRQLAADYQARLEREIGGKALGQLVTMLRKFELPRSSAAAATNPAPPRRRRD